MSLIEVKNVSKDFKVYQREKGFGNTVKSLFVRKYQIIRAVREISFTIEQGELIGYIGPNGAGKSTTIKMLAGILLPTAGEIKVDGIIPYQDRKKNAMKIGVVFGQRSQLNWDLPMEDTFELYRRMYRVEQARYRRNLEFFVELLGMKEFIRTPVRQLSLGQKMRAEIAIALLHDPQILYLDEPTIGLDVVVKNKIRHFIKELNREKATTVILTTHDMNDIDQICERIIMIDKGRILHDESLEHFKKTYTNYYYVQIECAADSKAEVDPRFKLIKKENEHKYLYAFNKEEISFQEVLLYFAQNFELLDISIKPPEIEEIVRRLYEQV